MEEPQQTTKDPVLAQFSQLDETLWTDFLSRNPEIAVDISGEVQGLDYQGRLAIVSDPARVYLAPCANLFESGQKLYPIAEDQGAVQVSLLDGGSSSLMYFHGLEITHPSTCTNNPHGRTLPNAWIVK